MITTCIESRHGEQRRLLHPSLEPALAETEGVVVFHEQVLQIVAETTGVTLAQADEVRRTMGTSHGQAEIEAWWRPAARARGYAPADVDRIWEVLKSFASFGFCKAHAAAFALPTYHSAWLKTHHPAAFLAGVLTHDPGMYPKRLILDDARSLGIAVLGLDVNASGDTSASSGSTSVARLHVPDAPRPADAATTASGSPHRVKGISESHSQIVRAAVLEPGDSVPATQPALVARLSSPWLRLQHVTARRPGAVAAAHHRVTSAHVGGSTGGACEQHPASRRPRPATSWGATRFGAGGGSVAGSLPSSRLPTIRPSHHRLGDRPTHARNLLPEMTLPDRVRATRCSDARLGPRGRFLRTDARALGSSHGPAPQPQPQRVVDRRVMATQPPTDRSLSSS